MKETIGLANGAGEDGGLPGHLALCLAIVGLVVLWVSGQPSFLETYHLFGRLASRGSIPLAEFAVYQLAYGLIFVSGESFWRGYILFGLERDLG